MNGLVKFCQRHRLTVREVSKICGGPKYPKGGISYATVHRLLHDQLNGKYRTEIELPLIHSLRAYLRDKGMTEEEILREVPDEGFFSPIRQITHEITVPDDCAANYVFKDRYGKVLSIAVFDQRA